MRVSRHDYMYKYIEQIDLPMYTLYQGQTNKDTNKTQYTHT